MKGKCRKFLETAATLIIAVVFSSSSTGAYGSGVPATSSSHVRAAPLHWIKRQHDGIGTCTGNQVDDILAGIDAADSEFDFETTCFDDERPEAVCRDDCLNVQFEVAEKCSFKDLELLYRAYCGQFGGKYCLEYEFDTAVTTSKVESCTDATTCEPDCKQSLEDLAQNLGCCFNNLFNISNFFVTDSDQYSTLVSYDQWKECGVTNPEFCLHDSALTKSRAHGSFLALVLLTLMTVHVLTFMLLSASVKLS